MEDPLIGRDSRGGGADRVRRSEAITHGTPFQKAAALVDLVLHLSRPNFEFVFLFTFQKVSIHESHRLQEKRYSMYLSVD